MSLARSMMSCCARATCWGVPSIITLRSPAALIVSFWATRT
jgi:hypothetical protein